MNRKAIKSVLQRKFNKWVESIEDSYIRSIVKENSIITGGAIVSLLLNEEPNDYDIYFKTRESVKAVVEYYVSVFNSTHGKKEVSVVEDGERIKIFIKSAGVAGDNVDEDADEILDIVKESFEEEIKEEVEKKEEKKYKPVFLTSNAITLSNDIQIVIRFFGEPEEIHKNYDFIHCTCYWTSWDGDLELPAKALEAILNKELIFQGSRYPICSILRIRKFMKRGFRINAGQILKICFAISELDLNDIKVLEDQLIGVDFAYFASMIASLRSMKEKDPSFNYGYEYISSIVDKIFN